MNTRGFLAPSQQPDLDGWMMSRDEGANWLSSMLDIIGTPHGWGNNESAIPQKMLLCGATQCLLAKLRVVVSSVGSLL